MSTTNLSTNAELEPSFYLVDDSKTNIDDLTEVFIVIYKEDMGMFREPKENYIFFSDFKTAFNRHKMIGSTQSLIKRVFTDDEKLIKLAQMNTIVIPDENKEETKETEKDDGSIKPVSTE
jgi:hypothetical protein